MIPQIPDNIIKLVIAIGLFLIGYGSIKSELNTDLSLKESDQYSNIISTYNDHGAQYDMMRQQLAEKSNELSMRYKVKSPYYLKDSTYRFDHVVSGNKGSVFVNDLINKDFFKIEQFKFNLDRELERVNRAKKISKIKSVIYDITKDEYSNLFDVGVLLTIIGLIGLASAQIAEINQKDSEIQSNKRKLHCQSCAKRFNSMVQNAKFNDGQINPYYCAECFTNNQFTNSALTKDLVLSNYLTTKKIKDMISKQIAKSKIQNLLRWREGPY
jgi:hypothetical protein